MNERDLFNNYKLYRFLNDDVNYIKTFSLDDLTDIIIKQKSYFWFDNIDKNILFNFIKEELWKV